MNCGVSNAFDLGKANSSCAYIIIIIILYFDVAVGDIVTRVIRGETLFYNLRTITNLCNLDFLSI